MRPAPAAGSRQIFREEGNAILKQKLRLLHRRKKAGVAMITLLCAAAIFLALASALVYSASNLLATANMQLEQERCYQLAKTFSEALGRDLCVKTPPSEDSQSVYHYANSFLDDLYNIYDPDHINNTTYSYSTTVAGDSRTEFGTITVRLYKEETDTEGTEGIEEKFQLNSEGQLEASVMQRVLEFEARTLNDYRFAVQVTAQLGGESYRYSQRYYRMVQYEPYYTLDGSRVYRVPSSEGTGGWSRAANHTQLIPKDELTEKEITATYDIKQPKARTFIQEGA